MKQKKSNLITNENKKEIFFNVINSLLAGGLVFLGSIQTGFSLKGLYVALIASLIVAVVKFKIYWESEAPEYCQKVFSFI